MYCVVLCISLSIMKIFREQKFGWRLEVFGIGALVFIKKIQDWGLEMVETFLKQIEDPIVGRDCVDVF